MRVFEGYCRRSSNVLDMSWPVQWWDHRIRIVAVVEGVGMMEGMKMEKVTTVIGLAVAIERERESIRVRFTSDNSDELSYERNEIERRVM
jgi:hypothetical protein